MAKFKKYQAGAANTAASGTGSGFGKFMNNYGDPIVGAAGTIMPLLMKKPDSNAKPYKKGSKLIKYDEGNKKTKILPDTGSSFEITMGDLADSALNAQAKGQSSSSSVKDETKPSKGEKAKTPTKGLSAIKQAGLSATAGAAGAALRAYGRSGPGKLKALSRGVGNAIQFISPTASAVESIRKNIDSKTGDISYAGALGQFILDQATGKIGGAAVRIPYKTASRTMQQVDDVMEDIAKRKETKAEYKAKSKEYWTGKKDAVKADAETDAKNLEKYQKDVAKYEAKLATRKKNKVRGQAPKPPVQPEPSKFNQTEFTKKEKPLLKYGERVNIKSVSQLAGEAASEEFKAPETFKKLQKYRDFISEDDKKLKELNRQKDLLIENRKKFKKLENTFGMSQDEFMGQLKKSGQSFEDFYQTKLNDFKKKGQKLTEQRKGKAEKLEAVTPTSGTGRGEGGKSFERKRIRFKNNLEAQTKQRRPERLPEAQQNLIKKTQTANKESLIKFREENVAGTKERIKNFLESKPATTTSAPQRVRKPVEDITPTPRKSQLLLPESSVTIQKRADKQARLKASRESSKLRKQQEQERLSQEAKALADKKAKQEKAAATRASNKENKINEKVKKIKFYGTGK